VTVSQNGTLNRVYGGDCNLVHIADKTRAAVGISIAADIEEVIVNLAEKQGVNTEGKKLCPGCYMIALFNAAITLADRNGQSRTELARSMAHAFTKLALNPTAGLTEEIEVLLDND
jgi:hypothetical protein